MMKTWSLLFLLSTFFATAFAQEGLKVEGQVRHRFESANKDFNSSNDYITSSFLRSRIGISFTPETDVEAFVQFQDSRLFGEEHNTLTDGSANALDLHQGYFKVMNAFKQPVDVKAGRMEVNLGPQRLVGAVGWHNIGRSFDGVLMNVHPARTSIDVFLLEETQNDSVNLNILGVYGDIKIFEQYKSQAFFIWQKEGESDLVNRYTTGFYLEGKYGAFSNELEFAYQGGSFQALDVDAFMFAVNLAYKVSTSIKPSVGIGLDYLSGDGNPADGSFKVFDTLYATNHKYYGYMDFFLNIPAHTLGLGLMDAHLKASVSPLNKTTVSAAAHMFNGNKGFTLSGGSTSKSFGTEVDLVLKHNYSKAVTLLAGGSWFSAGDIFKQTRGNDMSTWFFIQTLVNM